LRFPFGRDEFSGGTVNRVKRIHPGPGKLTMDATSPAVSTEVNAELVNRWLQRAEADADSRGLPELRPILRQFARAMIALREAEHRLFAGDD